MPIYGKKGPVFSMFHQKSRGVSLILFSDGVPEMESVEKPNYARHGHGASILDHTNYSNLAYQIFFQNFFLFERRNNMLGSEYFLKNSGSETYCEN